jgi:hypothetical protein
VYGVLTMLLIQPLAAIPASASWVRVVGRTFYTSLMLFAVVLIIVAARRIDSDALTELRYFLVAGGIWLLAVGALFCPAPFDRTERIPLTLFVMVIATSFGPWGAFDWSVRSQVDSVRRSLLERGADGKLEYDATQRINRAMDFLNTRERLDALLSLVSQPVEQTSTSDGAALWRTTRERPEFYDLRSKLLGLRSQPQSQPQQRPEPAVAVQEEKAGVQPRERIAAVSVNAPTRFVFTCTLETGGRFAQRVAGVDFGLRLAPDTLLATRNDVQIAKLDLSPVLEEVLRHTDHKIPARKLSYVMRGKDTQVDVFIEGIEYTLDTGTRTGSAAIARITAQVFWTDGE